MAGMARYGTFWLCWVGNGTVRLGEAGKVRSGLLRRGLSGFVEAWSGMAGMAC